MNDLIASLDLGSARGRKAEPLEVSIVRPLGEADIEALVSPPEVAAPAPTLKSIRTAHHQLARLLSTGQITQEAVSAITGYSPTYISNIQRDPTFVELMSYYKMNQEVIYTDALERMKSFGLTLLEDLQESYEQESDLWTRKEKRELIELLLVKPQLAKTIAQGSGSGGPARARVEIEFVGVKPQVTRQEDFVDAKYEDISQ